MSVPDLCEISEGYFLQQAGAECSAFTVDVSAERLEDTFLSLDGSVHSSGFAMVEVPTRP